MYCSTLAAPPLLAQNCRGLKVDSRIDEITDALVQWHAYAAGFQETWRKGKEQLLCASTGSLFLGVGPDEQHGRGSMGVAIWLS